MRDGEPESGGGEVRRRLRADLDRLAGRRGRNDFSKGEFRRRLERLREMESRRQSGPAAGDTGQGASAAGGAPGALRYGRMVARTSPAASSGPAVNPGEPVDVMAALPCEEVTLPPFGRYVEICEPVVALPEGDALNRTFSEQLRSEGSAVRHCIAPLLTGDTHLPELEQLVFMDVESTGLGSSPLFLIGVMVWEGTGFVVRQYFARSYAEECAVVAVYLGLLSSKRLLVTFNGKSFDWPYIKARAAATGAGRTFPELLHLDLLHAGRRAWKHQLPNCRLQTLERHICGRIRTGDIPSAEIPEAYHAYVRTGDGFQMVPALEHNKLDLVTLADLMTRFPVPEAP